MFLRFFTSINRRLVSLESKIEIENCFFRVYVFLLHFTEILFTKVFVLSISVNFFRFLIQYPSQTFRVISDVVLIAGLAHLDHVIHIRSTEIYHHITHLLQLMQPAPLLYSCDYIFSPREFFLLGNEGLYITKSRKRVVL